MPVEFGVLAPLSRPSILPCAMLIAADTPTCVVVASASTPRVKLTSLTVRTAYGTSHTRLNVAARRSHETTASWVPVPCTNRGYRENPVRSSQSASIRRPTR